MSSWLAKRLGIHWDLSPLAGVAGFALGGPLGAGLATAASRYGKDHNLRGAIKDGVIGGAGSYVGSKLLPKISGHFGGGGGSPAPTDLGNGMGFNPGAATPAPYPMAGGGAALSSVPSAVPSGGGGGSLLGGLKGGLARAGHYATAHPEVIGKAAEGVLGAREASQSNALRQREFDFQRQQYDTEEARKAKFREMLTQMFAQLQQPQPPIR